jgi:hypothetical protein
MYLGGFGDEFIDRALDKLLSQQRVEDETALHTLRTDLDELERRYGYRSEEFSQRYQSGEMGDDADFVEWNALYRMYTKVQNRLTLLQG